MQIGIEDVISPQTREQMITAACSIDPRLAYQVKHSDDAGYASATPLYTEFIDRAGNITKLDLSNGKFGAGYIRVSTIKQRRDGWSIQDQAARIVDYFLEKRMAFRIFSDSSLSGKLPMDSKELIVKMHLGNAERYRRSYQAVFLTSPQRRELGPERVAQMEEWLKEQTAIIEKGGKGEGLLTDLDKDDGDEPSAKKLYRGRKRKNDAYRPGLSQLLYAVEKNAVGTLAVTDVSRLARSQALQVIVTDKLNEHHVHVVGLIETTEYINDRTDLSNNITAAVLSMIAEHKLREVSIGAFRGIAEMLRDGKPHGSIPYWCKKDNAGKVTVNDSAVGTLKAIIRLYLNDDGQNEREYGLQKLANLLNADLAKYPPPPTMGKRKRLGYWSATSIKFMLKNPALCGEQHSFGQEWKVLPEIISKGEWLRLQARIKTRGQAYGPVVATDHLLAYLMKCQCGSTVAWNSHVSGSTYYTCDAARRSKAGKGNMAHVKMDATSIENFIERIARENPNFLLDPHRDLPERKTLGDKIRNLRAQAIKIEEQLPNLIEAARQQAKNDLLSMKRNPSTATVDAMAEDDADVIKARSTLDKLTLEIEQYEDVLKSIMPSDRVEETALRLEQWERLSRGQKNEILRRLIYQIRGERNETGMRLYIRMNNIQRTELPAVHMIMTPHGQGFTIKPPSVIEWLATW